MVSTPKSAPRGHIPDAILVGGFTVLASLLSSLVPVVVGDTQPAAIGIGPDGTNVPGPLSLLVLGSEGRPWTGAAATCMLRDPAQPAASFPTRETDPFGRCTWDALPPGAYVVTVRKGKDGGSLEDEFWGELRVTAPYVGDAPRRVPVMARVATLLPDSEGFFRATVAVENRDAAPRAVWVRCVWDVDRIAPYDASDDTLVLTLAPGARAEFPCAAPLPGAPAGALRLGYEVHARYAGDEVTDSWWTPHQAAPADPPASQTPRA